LATSHYLQCQELLPENYICFLGLATVFMLRGDFDQFSHYLDLASQRVESDNFWITTIGALDALQNADMTEARRLLDNASAQNPNNDYLLRTSLILDLSLSSSGKFSRYIKQLIIENPNNSGLNLLLGLSSFYESNCSLAVSQYEQAIKENEYVMLDVWGFSIGVSHYLNLAYCYQELNRHKEAQESLKSYRNFIQSLPKAARTIPGIVYNEARYLVLTEKPDEAEALLGQIQDWPFIWLYDFDPVY